MKTVGVLTSSRADFGIYLPLLQALKDDSSFNLEIIVFGTHLSRAHGFTITEIENHHFDPSYKIDTYLPSNSPVELAKAIGHITDKFATFWANHNFDMVITLGDRYEMFAAVSAASPFNLCIAHIHAGETTLGAIDNAYRHSISLFSKHLFVSTEAYAKRAKEVVENHVGVYNVGALSIDNLSKLKYLSKSEFNEKFNINLNLPTILCTFHPETVSYLKNELYIHELLTAFSVLRKDFQIVMTMPNADTSGQMIRDKIEAFKEENSGVIVVESFGMIGYLSCMKHAAFLLGNTSSGFVEATYFPKYVINIGERQKGRLETENIITIPINSEQIVKTAQQISKLPELENLNIYGTGDTANKILKILKSI